MAVLLAAFAVAAVVSVVHSPVSQSSVALADSVCGLGRTVCQACNSSCPLVVNPQCVDGCPSPFGTCMGLTAVPACPPTHKACVNQACTLVLSSSTTQTDSCTADAQCIIIATSTPTNTGPTPGATGCANGMYINGPACTTAPDFQSCSVPVSITASASSPQQACDSLAASSLSSDVRQNVTGLGPPQMTPGAPGFGQPIISTYNSNYYATQDAASLLAQCLGGTLQLTSNTAAGSPFCIPETLEVVVNGHAENAGLLIQALIQVSQGNVANWKRNYVSFTTPSGTGSTGTTAGGTTNSSNGNTNTSGGTSASVGTTNSIGAIISGLQGSILSYRASTAAQAQIAANAAISGTASQNAVNQGLLAALRASLVSINSSLTTSTNIPQTVITSITGLLSSIAQIIQSLQIAK